MRGRFRHAARRPRRANCSLSHAGAILVNADSPTLPASILRAAVDATRRGGVVLGPALDGGYTLIGVSGLHARLYQDIPWSTSEVHRKTVERAAEIGLPVVNVPGWYDVDDAASLALLESELAGETLAFAQQSPARARPRRARISRSAALVARRIGAVTAVAHSPASGAISRCSNSAPQAASCWHSPPRRRGSCAASAIRCSSRRSRRPDLSRSSPPGSPRTLRRGRRSSSCSVSRWRCGSRWSASSR